MRLPKCNKRFTTSHYTVAQARGIKETATNRFPAFDIGKMKALYPGHQMWDNWGVRAENGYFASVLGFKVLVALIRPRGADFSVGERIAFLYSKDGEHYEVGGELFADHQLYDGVREWSGSTILRDDGKLQTFYTVSYGAEIGGVWQTVQRFATAIQTVSVEDGKLKVSAPIFHSLLGGACEPDGLIYETPAQASERELALPTAHSRFAGSDQTENNCFRDPCFFKDQLTGKKYLVFEGNTGPLYNAPGVVSKKYIGGSAEGFAPTPDMLKANGCIGIIELVDDDYTFGIFQKPWLTANLVTDEIERINVISDKTGVYLFCAGHGNKNALNKENPDLVNRDYLLGFKASYFGGELTPLNGSGVVVQQKSMGEAYGGQASNQQYVYSWILVPSAKSDATGVFDCLSYANYSVIEDGTIAPVMGIAPTISIEIKNKSTRIVGMKYDIQPA